VRLPRALLLFGLCLPFALSALDVTFQPTQATNVRFKDIGAQVFGTNYIGTYNYANASVILTLNQSGLKYLDGTLTATGLKPNFAYQVKLAGRPSRDGQTAEEAALADDVANEMIGRVGRWWRAAPTPGNTNDADFDLNKNNPSYLFQGYMPVAFFVTDASGSASVRVLGNNSYHVLWRVDQRPPSSNDGPLLDVLVPSTSGNSAYDATVAARSYQLYGEWEPTRALPGQLVMMDGAYNCDLELTEESFHESGVNSGNWTSVLRSAVTFTIPTTFGDANPNPDPNPNPSSPLALKISRVRLSVPTTISDRDSGMVDFTAALPTGVELNGLSADITVQGVTHTFVIPANGRARSGSARLTAKKADRSSTTVRFRVQLSKENFVFTSEPIPANPLISIALQAGTTRYAGEVSATANGTRRVSLQFRQ